MCSSHEGGAVQPKGNGINDGFVRWLCVYAVVFWLAAAGLCGCPPKYLAHKIFNYGNEVVMQVYFRLT